MALALVTNQLQQLASACAAKAVRANDPDTIAALHKAEEQFRRLQAMVQANMTELEAYRAAAAAKAAKASQKGRIGALEFWRRHGLAVDAIRAVYGDNWKIKAPYGETEIVSVPNGWRSCKTQRGTELKWPRDARMPAARFWMDGKLPPALTVVPDYARASPIDGLVGKWQSAAKWFRQSLRRRNIRFSKPHVEEEWEARDLIVDLGHVRAARAALKAVGATPGSRAPDGGHDDAWHLAHGYVLHGGDWVFEIGLRASQQHAQVIEDNRLTAIKAAEDKAAAEDAEVDSEMPLAEAAD